MVLAAARIVVVADDLTGAADTAAGFVQAGLGAVVTWRGSDGGLHAPADAETISIDTATRVLDEPAARTITAEAVAELGKTGVSSLYIKGDSLLRGHIGIQVGAALAAWSAGAIAIAAFAFPEAGRTTFAGRQHVRGQPLEPSMAELFERAGLRTAVVAIDDVRDLGLRNTLQAVVERGTQVIACDAVTTEDLAGIVRAGMKLETPVVWVGSGGLARALAPELGAGEHPRRRLLTPVRPGPVIIVSGSASDIAREQAARVARAGAVPIELDASGLVANDIRTQNMFGEIREHLSLARDLVMTVTPSADMDDPRISRALGALVAPFRSVVGGLVSAGGDTAAAVLRAWGVTALIVCDEIEPGVPLSIAVGPDPVGVVTKAGAFGDPDTFVRARERLRMLIKSQAVAR